MTRSQLLRPGTPRRAALLPRPAALALALAGAAACKWTCSLDFLLPRTVLSAAPAAAGEASALAGVSPDATVREAGVAREAILVPWKGSSRYKSYDGFVFKKKRVPGVRLRLDRYGTGHWPFYKIRAAFQKRKTHRSGRFLEAIGFWDPMKEVDDPRFFKLKADRAVFWLRQGAQPTDMVANLLDRAGIIRRTGPLAKRGEWEWRIPKNSGPEAPEGWSYDGSHDVTWENKPAIHHRKGKPHNPRKVEKIPLIERYGFKGYEKIPIDGDVLTAPVDGSSLLYQLDNTELPVSG